MTLAWYVPWLMQPWMPSLYGPRNLSGQIAYRKMLSRVPRKSSLAVRGAPHTAPCPQFERRDCRAVSCPMLQRAVLGRCVLRLTQTRPSFIHAHAICASTYVEPLTQIYDTSQVPRRQAVTVDDSSVPHGLRSSLAFESPEQITSLNLIQTLEARRGQWTITDVNISPDNQWIVYSSISPYVGLSPVRPAADTDDPSANQVTLDFSANAHDSAGVRRSTYPDLVPPVLRRLARDHCGLALWFHLRVRH